MGNPTLCSPHLKYRSKTQKSEIQTQSKLNRTMKSNKKESFSSKAVTVILIALFLVLAWCVCTLFSDKNLENIRQVKSEARQMLLNEAFSTAVALGVGSDQILAKRNVEVILGRSSTGEILPVPLTKELFDFALTEIYENAQQELEKVPEKEKKIALLKDAFGVYYDTAVSISDAKYEKDVKAILIPEFKITKP